MGVLSATAATSPPPPYHSNLIFVTLRNRRPTLLRAPAYRTPSKASPRRRCGHASRVLCRRSSPRLVRGGCGEQLTRNGPRNEICKIPSVDSTVYDDADCLPSRDTSPHQDSTDIAPSGTPPPAKPPPPPQTRGTQSHSAPNPLKLRPMADASWVRRTKADTQEQSAAVRLAPARHNTSGGGQRMYNEAQYLWGGAACEYR